MAYSTARVAVEAYDFDLVESTHLQYRIASGDPAGLFQINASTGAIELLGSLDYENSTEHVLSIQVVDNPSRSATATVTVTVNDVNDNKPQFSAPVYDIHINENTPAGTTVLTLTATDQDSTSNALLRYDLNSCLQVTRSAGTWEESTDNSTFRLVVENVSNAQVAHVVVWHAANLDFETVREFVYTVNVTDYGQPSLSDNASLTIHLVDVNENHPQITAIPSSLFYLEDEGGLIPTPLFSSVNITDTDTLSLIQGARISLMTKGNYSENKQKFTLEYNPTMFPGLCVSNNGTGTSLQDLYIEGGMTRARYEAVLRGLYYENTAEEFLYNDTAVFTIQITDEVSNATTGPCGFDSSRNFTSLVYSLVLQERNDKPIYLGPSELAPLPVLFEDPPDSANIGYAVWNLSEFNVVDNDDISGNAVYGVAVIKVTSDVNGSFEYTNQQIFATNLTSPGTISALSGTATLTVAWDSSISLQLQMSWRGAQPSDVQVQLRSGQAVFGRVDLSPGDRTNFNGTFVPGQRENIPTLQALEAQTLEVHIIFSAASQLSGALQLLEPLTWHQVRQNSSESMAALVGSGGRFRFRPDLHANGNGSAILLVWDQREGEAGTSAFNTFSHALSSSVANRSMSIGITVLPVNDAPVIRLGGVASLNFTTTFVDGLSAVPIVDHSSLTITDVENDTIVSVQAKIYGGDGTACNYSQEQPGCEADTPNLDRITFTPQDLFELGVFNATGAICKTWNITTNHTDKTQRGTTISNWQQYLRTAKFFNLDPEPYNHTRLVEFVAFDGKVHGLPAYAVVKVVAFNNATPHVTNTQDLQFVEGDPCSAIGANFSVTYLDCPATILWADIFLQGHPGAGSIQLNASSNPYNIQITHNQTVINMNGSAPVMAYQDLLRSLVYINLANEPSIVPQYVAAQVRGRVAVSDLYRFPLTPQLISDNPPDLLLNRTIRSTNVSFVENSLEGVRLVEDNGIVVNDNDSTISVSYSMTMTLSDPQDGGSESLSVPAPSTLNVFRWNYKCREQCEYKC